MKGQTPWLLISVLVVLEAGLYVYGWTVSPDDRVPWHEASLGETTVELGTPEPGGPADRAGLKEGDRLLRVEGRPLEVYRLWSTLDAYAPGSTVRYTIERSGERMTIPVALESVWSHRRYFYIFYYGLMALAAGIGVFVLLRRRGDPSARLFFAFTQIYAICLNSALMVGGTVATLRTSIFVLVFPFLGTTLLHFLLTFPVRSRWLDRRPRWLWVLYGASTMFSLLMAATLVHFEVVRSVAAEDLFFLTLRLGLLWMAVTVLASMAVAVYTSRAVREITAHNQMRWVMLGLVFGLLPEAIFGFFPELIWRVEVVVPMIGQVVWLIGTIILVGSLSFAILRYRLWDIELILRHGLLYAGVTAVVVGAYLLIVLVAGLVIDASSTGAQAGAVALAALIFLPVREWIQRRIDRLFHREAYDASDVILEFDRRMPPLADENALCGEIADRIDGVFHFYAFGFFRMTPAGHFRLLAARGPERAHLPARVELHVDRPVAVRELTHNPFAGAPVELIVPILHDDQVTGFFACGPKRSDRVYTRQDVQLLSVLAGRTAGLIHTAELYRREVERQTLLERERMRISKDMHDDVGASLTKIAILGELAGQKLDPATESAAHVRKISTTAREVIDEISEIIWALNPRNDKLDNLVAYVRAHLAEYFEPTPVACRFDIPETLPPLPVSSEIRRNLLLVLKEAAHNVVKHARASQVYVGMQLDGSVFEAVVEDDGCGFACAGVEAAVTSGGNGLVNMRRRLDEIGGTLDIEPPPDGGTRVRLTVDLNTTFVR